MRALCLVSLFCLSTLLQAADAPSSSMDRALQLAGIRLLCEQSAPLLVKDLDVAQRAKLEKLFAADPLCADLALKVSAQLTPKQIEQMVSLLESPLAQRFTKLERAVGAETDGGFSAYRQQLADKPPRGARVELVQRLDEAAHATQLAVLLRYEVGKTQAWISVQQAGHQPDEKTLTEQTTTQAAQLQESVSALIEAYMLYAYRQVPSDQIEAYAELYEQDAVKQLLDASVTALPQVFAERRAQLK